jgi:hypothetical protein
MRKTLGLLALFLIGGVPLDVRAQPVPGSAPADEYFGPHHQSILEIRNRLDRLDARSREEMLDPNVVIELDDINRSIFDWQRQYPNDPWLPRTLARLMRSYHRAGAASTPRAVATLDLMRRAYPNARETSETIAMIYGDVDAAEAQPAAPAPLNVWARFDSMRQPATTDPNGGP